MTGQRVPKFSTKGFTLIEVLLYTIILASMMAFLVVSVFQLLNTQKNSRNEVSVETESDFLMKKIEWALTGAQSISAPAPSATGSVLSVVKADYALNPITFDSASGTARIVKANGSSTALTSDDISIQTLIFQHQAQVGNFPEGITITIVAYSSSTAGAVRASTTLQNTIYLNK